LRIPLHVPQRHLFFFVFCSSLSRGRARAYDFVTTVALSTDFQIAEFEFRNDLACRQKEGLILLYLNSTLGEL
jgi:hypothetical protein